jgi:hypothetical protein
MTRPRTLVLAACALVVLVPLALAQTPAPTPPATQAPPTAPPPDQPTLGDDKDTIEAGQKWLALIDAEKADVAWDVASKQLQSVVKRDKFAAEMRQVRKPLGKLESRTAVKFARSHELPGAPAGDYAIIEFDAKFTNGKHLAEQLIWALEDRDVWRVAGYYYR